MDLRNASRAYGLKGARYQLPMIFLFVFRTLQADGFRFSLMPSFSFDLSVGGVIEATGLLIMAIAMVRIYWNISVKGPLITTGMFAVTRHPMYHGMFIADLADFFRVGLGDPFFWGTWIAFVGLLLTAGWYQEQETLARWGEQAGRYYARTPRFAFEWLWYWSWKERTA